MKNLFLETSTFDLLQKLRVGTSAHPFQAILQSYALLWVTGLDEAVFHRCIFWLNVWRSSVFHRKMTLGSSTAIKRVKMWSCESAKRTTSRKQHLNLPEINVLFYMLGLLKTIYWNSKILAKSATNSTSIIPSSRRKNNEMPYILSQHL